MIVFVLILISLCQIYGFSPYGWKDSLHSLRKHRNKLYEDSHRQILLKSATLMKLRDSEDFVTLPAYNETTFTPFKGEASEDKLIADKAND
jgi:hypothetical protein